MTTTQTLSVNRENSVTAQTFEHRSIKNSDKTPLRVRRNGATQLWKTRPNDFRIPVKYGLYGYSNITQNDCKDWYITS